MTDVKNLPESAELHTALNSRDSPAPAQAGAIGGLLPSSLKTHRKPSAKLPLGGVPSQRCESDPGSKREGDF